jgi:ABC-2 type transport system permease protein
VPWLFLFLVPALTMRLWAEERRSGTIEMLLTLPIAPWQAVLGKWLAAWGVLHPGAGSDLSAGHHRQPAGRAGQRCGAARAISAARWWPAPTWRWAPRLGADAQPGHRFRRRRRGLLRLRRRGSPIVADFLSVRWPALSDAARGFSVAEHFGGFVRGVIAATGCGVLRELHRLLALRQRGDPRAAQGRLGDAPRLPLLALTFARSSRSASTCWPRASSRRRAST